MNKIVDIENRLYNTQTSTKHILLAEFWYRICIVIIILYVLHTVCVYDLYHILLVLVTAYVERVWINWAVDLIILEFQF
jgi:hypothetical protein